MGDPSKLAAVKVTRIAQGTYRVERDGRHEIVYIAGPARDRWVFWNGHVFHGDFRVNGPAEAGHYAGTKPTRNPESPAKAGHYSGTTPARYEEDTDVVSGFSRTVVSATSITAPMPARVTQILVHHGALVKKGDTVVVLEAMKMEWPIRAPADAVVTAVHCREGELVQADAVLVDLDPRT